MTQERINYLDRIIREHLGSRTSQAYPHVLPLGIKGADTPSATTLRLGDGDYFHITGTVTITSLGVRPSGQIIILEFDGACILTYSATSLILQGAVNYTTVAGDVLIFISEGNGNWREVSRNNAAIRNLDWDLVWADAVHSHASDAEGGTIAYSVLTGVPSLSIIGPTFVTSDVTMTNLNTWYTAVTLGSALVNGAVYLLNAQVLLQDTGVANDGITVEIYDSTNSIEIAASHAQSSSSLDKFVAGVITPIKYSGFSGTPTIILRCLSEGAGDKIKAQGITAASGIFGYIQAVRVG